MGQARSDAVLLEEDAGERGKQQPERVGPPVGRDRGRPCVPLVPEVAAAVIGRIAVEQLHIAAGLGDPHDVVVTRHGSEVDSDHEKVIELACAPNERDDAALIVAAVDPPRTLRGPRPVRAGTARA